MGLSAAPAQAQNYNEIFRQKRTQERYLIKQLAYLRLYAGQLKKGYDVVSGGLETVRGFTSGEFKLHEAFLNGLSAVSSLVRKDARVSEIVKFQLNINSSFRALEKTSASLTQAPKDYLSGVREKLMEDCNTDLDELLDIVLSGDLEMNDSERLSRLSKVHASMEDKADFARWLSQEAQLLARAKNNEKNDIESLRRLHEKN
ncbi:MAG: hypothetical protein REI78_02815 [Pedobacter sp.]|nr:hypothetical protein [Pedobacter sp.]